MSKIELTEKEKRLLTVFLNKIGVSNPIYLLDREDNNNFKGPKSWEKDWRRIRELRKKLLSIFYDKIISYISNNPGVTTQELSENFLKEEAYYRVLQSLLRLAEKKGIIKKSESKLYLQRQITRKEFFMIWEKVPGIWSPLSQKYIPANPYPNSKQLIENYFGEETLKTLIENYFGEEILKILNEWKWIKEERINHFLSLIGGSVKFEMNNALKEVIERYWSKECDIKFRKFLDKYGFFSENAFIDYELEKIIGEDRFSNFFQELHIKAALFRIRRCAFVWDAVYPKYLPYCYAQSLKFKWGLKPEILLKRCKYCGKKFIPSLEVMKYYMRAVIDYYPIQSSINEINFCSQHFPPSYKTEIANYPNWIVISKRKLIESLKKLVDIIGFIPPSNFQKNLGYLQNLNRKKFEETIQILNDMPPYKEMFDSWIEVLIEADLIEKNHVLKTTRGYLCLAEDGHLCLSIGEKIIDDWLYKNNIPHEKEKSYPIKKAFKADWKVGKYFIEFWGMEGDRDYNKRRETKKKLAQEHKIPLIELTPSDLPLLDIKLKKLKDIYGNRYLQK